MSARQARIARKARQREGLEAFVHIKPQKRVLLPLENRPRPFPGQVNPAGTGIRARNARKRLYGENA